MKNTQTPSSTPEPSLSASGHALRSLFSLFSGKRAATSSRPPKCFQQGTASSFNKVLICLLALAAWPLSSCGKNQETEKTPDQPAATASSDEKPGRSVTSIPEAYVKFYTDHISATKILQDGKNKMAPEIHRLQLAMRNFMEQGIGLPPSYGSVSAFLRENLEKYRKKSESIDYSAIDKKTAETHKKLVAAIIEAERARIHFYDTRTDTRTIWTFVGDFNALPEWARADKYKYMITNPEQHRAALDESMERHNKASQIHDEANSLMSNNLDKFLDAITFAAHRPEGKDLMEWVDNTLEGKEFIKMDEMVVKNTGYDKTKARMAEIDEERERLFPTSRH